MYAAAAAAAVAAAAAACIIINLWMLHGTCRYGLWYLSVLNFFYTEQHPDRMYIYLNNALFGKIKFSTHVCALNF
jgi:hypothetical protein